MWGALIGGAGLGLQAWQGFAAIDAQKKNAKSAREQAEKQQALLIKAGAVAAGLLALVLVVKIVRG